MRTLTTQLPEFGSLGGAASTPSETEVRSALDSKVSHLASMVLPGVGLFLLLAGAFDAIGSTVPVPASALATTWLSAVTALTVGGALKYGVIPSRLANAAASGAIASVLMQAIVRLWTTPLALPSIHVILLVVGASSVLLSWRWFAATLAISVGSWSLSAWLLSSRNEGLETSPFVEALALAAMVAFVIHHRRMRAYHNRFRAEMIEARRKESLSQVQRRYESAVRGANDGLWFWDLEAEQIYVSAKWAQMVGCPEGALRLSPDAWWDSVDPYYVDSLRSALNAHVEGASSQFECKYRIRKQDGDHIWVLARGLATRDDKGVARSVAGSMTDISHVMEIEQQLVNDALQDKLTSLANRHRLMMDLQFAVEESLQDGKLIALIFLDLDDFKYVNDNLGHPVGDQLLTEIAKRLWTCTRPTDTLARYGGDEFVLLLNELSEANEAEDIGRRMQQVLAAPIEVSGHSLKVTASVGISINCPVVRQHEDLLRNADIAMYKAKAEGKGELRVFNSEMQSQARRSWELFNVVRGVVDREECSVHYQPIVSLDDGRVAGAEALFRWQGPKNAQRTTSELIIAAERTGSIIGIGEWVLRKVCADAVDWQRRGLTPIQVSANVSAHQLRLPGFPEIVKRILRDEGLDPHWLELELTETAFMHDIETVCGNLRRLVDLGVGLAIDDFGTGYSSLGYLAKFPLKTLKIDGSFVSGITVDPHSAALTKGIISLAHSLGLSVTAEKVENVRQLQFLTTEGCDCVQGYLASPALAADDMARILGSDDRLLSTVRRKAYVSRREVELVLLRQAVGN